MELRLLIVAWGWLVLFAPAHGLDVAVAGWQDVLPRLGIPTSLEDRYLVVPLLHSGLGRRLQLLASAQHAAVESGRRLIAAWNPSPHCAASLDDLFEPTSLDSLGVVQFNGSWPFLAMFVPRYLSHTEDNPIMAYDNTSFELLPVVRVAGSVLETAELRAQASAPVVILDPPSGAFFTTSESRCHEYYPAVSTSLSSLRPAPAVAERVDRVVRAMEGSDLMIGIHIRRDDRNYDSPVVLNLMAGGNDVVGWNESVAGEAYVEAALWLTRHDSVERPVVYVASNDHESKEQAALAMTERGLRVVIWESLQADEEESQMVGGGYDRQSVAGVQHALAEMIALGMCDFVVHPTGSSFAKVAAYMGRALTIELQHHLRIAGPELVRRTSTSQANLPPESTCRDDEVVGGPEELCNTPEFLAEWVLQRGSAEQHMGQYGLSLFEMDEERRQRNMRHRCIWPKGVLEWRAVRVVEESGTARLSQLSVCALSCLPCYAHLQSTPL